MSLGIHIENHILHPLNIMDSKSPVDDGKKKIKIPVRGIKEYKFVYGKGEGSKGVGSAQGKNIKRGQRVNSGNRNKKASGEKPGNKKGEEIYEVEISLDELCENCPKEFKQIVRYSRNLGYKEKPDYSYIKY